jgi:hypothetical protein
LNPRRPKLLNVLFKNCNEAPTKVGHYICRMGISSEDTESARAEAIAILRDYRTVVETFLSDFPYIPGISRWVADPRNPVENRFELQLGFSDASKK